jgi:hypothetical protein
MQSSIIKAALVGLAGVVIAGIGFLVKKFKTKNVVLTQPPNQSSVTTNNSNQRFYCQRKYSIPF